MNKGFFFCALLTFGIQSMFLIAQPIELSVQKGHSGNINVVIFSGDGKLLASAGADNQIKLWHVPTGKEMATLISSSSSSILALKFIEQDSFLMVKYQDGSLQRWNVHSSKLESTQGSDHEVRFHSNLLNVRDSTEQIFIDRFYLKKKNVKTGKVNFAKVPVDISKVFTSIVASEKVNKIFAANEDGRIYVFDLISGKSIEMLEGHYSSANSISLSPDETMVASASSDRSIILWDTKTLKPLRRLHGYAFRFESIAFDHSGNQLAVGDELGNGRVIDLVSSRVKVSTYQWHEQKVSAIAFSPDDKTIYTGGFDNRVKSFSSSSDSPSLNDRYKLYLSSGDFMLKIIGAYREPFAWINALAVSPGGTYLASGGGWRESDIRSQPQPVVLKNLSTAKEKWLRAHQKHVSDILFLDELNMLTAGANNLVKWFYNSHTNEYLFRELPLKKITGIIKMAAINNKEILLATDHRLFVYDLVNEIILDSLTEENEITDVAYSNLDSLIAYSAFNKLVLLKGSFRGKKSTLEQAHTDKITAIDFSPTRSILATCSWDATVKLWNSTSAQLLTTIISIGKDDHIIITPDNYYYGTRHSFRGFGFKYGKQFVSPEQFDLRFNRPDIVLDRLGFVPKNVVRSFNRAYQKRLQKMKFTEAMLSTEVQLPEVAITSDHVAVAHSNQFDLIVKATDTKYELDRINVFVNNIPVFGFQGLDVRLKNSHQIEEKIMLQLSPGKNKIQVSCLNEKGVESLLQTIETVYEVERAPKPILYLAVISVSNYADSKMNLKYAAKDGRDIVDMFSRSGWFDQVVVDSLLNERATRENILSLHEKLMKSSVNDHVILYVSGHGLLDENLEFYFATHSINFKNPAERGVRYDDLENLLDGIPARNKLLLMDACHSGEVDKSNVSVSERTVASGGTKGSIKTYTYPAETEAEHYQVGIKTSFELMQEVFSNLSKGSGGVVISAAAGNSYALESDQWKNGVFTFSLLNGIKSKAADLNRDGEVTVTELKDYVSMEVEKLTQGAQKPTSRRENLEFDFRVY
jgi:WD40 repeat protein